MLNNIITILECSRIFSLPMSIMSWLVIFVYAIVQNGNPFYGLLCLIGLCFVHLGANMTDDYIDYKHLIKAVDFDKDEYMKNTQKTKCRYILNGIIREKDLVIIAGSYFLVGLVIGLFLFAKCGIGILYFMLLGGLISVLYPLFSRICMAEVLLSIAFGPALFGGVYYAMTKSIPNEIYILSLPTMFIVLVLLYIHMVMDYDFDTNEGKLTIANRFNSQYDSLIVLKLLMILAYCSVVLLCIFDIVNWQIFIVFLTIPMSVDLYKSMESFTCNPQSLPPHKWYHFPMENIDRDSEKEETPFMIRMLQGRNLMIYFSVLMSIGILISITL